MFRTFPLRATRPTARLLSTTRPLPAPAQTKRDMSDPNLATAYTPERAAELKANLDEVLAEMRGAAGSSQPRLVAVSKIKPASDIMALYDAGHRDFGENYIQEMADKAAVLPADIRWHFIGSLQSNKAKVAAAVPNLAVLETLSSIKLAELLQKAMPTDRVLAVYLQVNTSGEDSKSGLPPLDVDIDKQGGEGQGDGRELVDVALHVLDHCPRLHLAGLMTIGSWDASHDASSPNPDFVRLTHTRDALRRVLEKKGRDVGHLELSMGMSADFAQAVRAGSDSVRVGTRIFGERPKKK
ncbi:hypothetical protein Q5752_001816 [Cryptotrichosporon argae]